MTNRLILIAALLAASVASANVVWRGDFNTGDRSQWSGTEMVSPDRLQIVSSPAWEGPYALKATVVSGDNPINASGNRNEIYRNTFEPSGSEYYYRWAVYFPSSFPYTPADQWHLFTQWHGTGCCGSPPLSFAVADDKFNLTLYSTNIWRSSDFSRGQWHEFILHAKWSSDPTVGFLELWHNGQLVMPKRYGANQNPGELNYLKMGLYRPTTITQTTTIYLDGMVQGTTLADVTGAVTPADAGTVSGQTDAGTSGGGTGQVDAGTSGGGTGQVDAGTSGGGTVQIDAGTSGGGTGQIDAGTSGGGEGQQPAVGTVENVPYGQATGSAGTESSSGETVDAPKPVTGGCSFVPMTAPMALLGLLGISRLRRRRGNRL